jgi:hypothetical protein
VLAGRLKLQVHDFGSREIRDVLTVRECVQGKGIKLAVKPDENSCSGGAARSVASKTKNNPISLTLMVGTFLTSSVIIVSPVSGNSAASAQSELLKLLSGVRRLTLKDKAVLLVAWL